MKMKENTFWFLIGFLPGMAAGIVLTMILLTVSSCGPTPGADNGDHWVEIAGCEVGPGEKPFTTEIEVWPVGAIFMIAQKGRIQDSPLRRSSESWVWTVGDYAVWRAWVIADSGDLTARLESPTLKPLGPPVIREIELDNPKGVRFYDTEIECEVVR